MKATEVQEVLSSLGDSSTASFLQRYFKTGPGEYGDGDFFRGIRVPVLKRLAKEFQDVALTETKQLLRSSYHEDRLLALLILVRAYSRGDDAVQERVFNLYINSTQFINNWDLVDSSAHKL